MKPHEGELVREISKLQSMVSELKAGFSRALLELNQIQQGDCHLQAELEDTRRGCNKRALHLEALVQSLREELGEIRCQIQQLFGGRLQAEQDGKSSQQQPGETRAIGNASAQRDKGADTLQGCSLEGTRQRLAMMLLHSEWEYVSSLGQLYDKYKTPPAPPNNPEPHKTFLKYVEQMLQRHLVFRNGLEDHLCADQWRCHIGDTFVKLTGQNDSGFSDAYLGYMTSLATILSAEFSQAQQGDKSQVREERDSLRLVSLLLAPVSRIHSYLSIIQNLLDWTSSGHPDRDSLQESQRVLRSLCDNCHTALEKDGHWGEEAVPNHGGRCMTESPDCVPSAFTKYCANPRMPQDTAVNGHPRRDCHLPTPQPVPAMPPSGRILRNDPQTGSLPHRVSAGHPVPVGCWPPPGCDWEGKADQCRPIPLRVPASLQSTELSLFLNPLVPGGAGGVGGLANSGGGSSAQALGRCLALDGRVSGRVYHLNRRLEDCDTDCDPEDLGDASVFDYSSVTSCSPDDILEMRGQGGGGTESREEEEEEGEEDSEIPVLLRPSYTHSALQPGGGAHREGSVCMRWQIPRTASFFPTQNPPDLCVGPQGSGTQGSGSKRLHSALKNRERLPTSAFRPIWDAPCKQGDVTPAKENGVTPRPLKRQERSILKPQPQNKESSSSGLEASVYGAECRGSPVGAQRTETMWNESEDSEGPCSTV
ncbi:uncharacterized protein LOC115810427 [Chanos chanos]|uniref:Uncharacterized protein LOC115810427 n=1 Tax=Chanos chanos TaxID=29144 RepID=A0A6J2V8Z5_CHACN|nr:uncharacterized protein LOC115810427 [Chanos chanos]